MGSLAECDDQNLADLCFYDSSVKFFTLLLSADDESLVQYFSQPESLFHSINSKSSIVRHIEHFGVEG